MTIMNMNNFYFCQYTCTRSLTIQIKLLLHIDETTCSLLTVFPRRPHTHAHTHTNNNTSFTQPPSRSPLEHYSTLPDLPLFVTPKISGVRRAPRLANGRQRSLPGEDDSITLETERVATLNIIFIIGKY